MKAVIQRVLSASVEVDGEVISRIGRGLCVLVGISKNDTDADIEYTVRKILNLRLFESEAGKRWDKSASALGLEILCVSQFTLHAVLKGNRPDYHLSMPPSEAPQFYAKFLDTLKRQYKPELVKDGVFGAYMSVNIANDGPVTLNIDSEKSASAANSGGPSTERAAETNAES